MVLAQAVSDAGPVRKNNEDSWAVEDDLQLYVVADGMGGHSAGEVASRLAVEALVGFIRRSHEETDVSWRSAACSVPPKVTTTTPAWVRPSWLRWSRRTAWSSAASATAGCTC